MPQDLHLEFACTNSELQKAQSLLLERKLGGGSKILTTIVLLLILAGTLLSFYVRVQREVSSAYRPLVYLGVAGICFILWLFSRRSHVLEPPATKLNVSEGGLRIHGPDGEAEVPWSAFARLLESPDLFVLVDRTSTNFVTIPRRAFPSVEWQDWFQTLAANRLNLPDSPVPGASFANAATEEGVSLDRIRLGWSDALDWTRTSWIPRFLIAGITTVILGGFAAVAAKPPPNPVYSMTQLLLYFIPPFLLAETMFVFSLIFLRNWWSQARGSATLDLSLASEAVHFRVDDASGALAWSAFDRFKETRRSFFVWSTRTPIWLMFPKRSFHSEDDVRRCRALLQEHLQESTWFLR